MRRKASRWERAGLSWTGKEREILRRGRQGRPRESYREIFLRLLRQRPARVNEYGEPVSHSMAAIYKEAQRLGLTKKWAKVYRINALQEQRDGATSAQWSGEGITLRGMSKRPCKCAILKG